MKAAVFPEVVAGALLTAWLTATAANAPAAGGLAPAATAETASPAAAAASAPAPTPPSALPPVGSLARRVLPCTACHGAEGRAVGSAFVPRIAGKPDGYLYRQLLNFRDGQRHNDAMARLLAPLSDVYLREIAGHFAALDLPWPAPSPAVAPAPLLQRGEQLVRRGDAARRLPACTACHGAALTGVAPAVPGLLGLPNDYITAQLGAWRAGTRRALAPDCMHTVATALDTEEVAAVAAWLAAQPMPAEHRAAASLPAPMPLRCGAVPASTQARR